MLIFAFFNIYIFGMEKSTYLNLLHKDIIGHFSPYFKQHYKGDAQKDFQISIAYDDAAFKELFLKLGATPSTYCDFLPNKIVKQLKSYFINYSTNYNFDPKQQQNLWLAVEQNDITFTNIFLNMGAEIHKYNAQENNAIILATKKCKPEMVKFLLYKGADVDSTDKNNQSILQIAANSCSVEMLKHILLCKPKLNHTDAFGKNAFDSAQCNPSIAQ
jgi:ankyrin repeat protein